MTDHRQLKRCQLVSLYTAGVHDIYKKKKRLIRNRCRCRDDKIADNNNTCDIETCKTSYRLHHIKKLRSTNDMIEMRRKFNRIFEPMEF